MPSDNAGNYSLPIGYLAVPGTTIQPSQHNPPLEDIATALSARLSRSGVAPMSGVLKFIDGTVGAPAATFNSDPTSGWYKTASGFAVAVGGVKVAEFLPGGVVGARFLGELIPFTCTAAPALTVLPYGQTLSRTTYAALWVQAQIEIAAGNTFYNNGDGSTTFGIGDLRGRVPFGRDTMGTVAASRLTTAGGGLDGATLGAVSANGQSKTLLTANLPPQTPVGTVASTVPTGVLFSNSNTSGASLPGTLANGNNGNAAAGLGVTLSSSFTGTAAVGQISTPFPIIPPSIVTNYILFAGA
jgi:microcystin-dependent protein